MPDARRAVVRLRVRSGPDKGRELLLSVKKEALLGRGRASDLRLTDPTVSQKHCLVRAAGDLVILEDLKGANGTWVNGQKVTQHVFDRDGVFLIGQTEVEVSWVACEEKPPSAPA